MKKAKKVMNSTSNGRVYRMTQRRALKCSLCAPHRGCNRWTSGRWQRSWKQYRKTQWKPQKQDSCNESWSERTDCDYNHMSHEKYKEGVSTPQETSEV